MRGLAAPMPAAAPPAVSRAGETPAVLVVALATALSLATVAGWLGLPVLHSRAGSLGLVILSAAAGLGLIFVLRPSAERTTGFASLLLALPAIGVVAPALVGLARGVPRGLEWFLNGDHPRHAVYVADTWVQGGLSYDLESYPRGWHSILAALWSVVGAGLDAVHVTRLLVLMAAASLVLSATLSLAMVELGHALALRAGLRRKGASGVGLLVGALTLLNFALANYQALGYENSLLAAVVLAVCSREVVVRPGSVTSLVVCTAGTLIIAHTWQLLLPPVVGAALWCAFCAFRTGARAPRWTVLAAVPLSFAVGAPGVLAVVSEVGLGHATEAGPDTPVPLTLLVGGLLSTAILAWRRKDSATTCLAAITVAPTAIALVLAVGLGLDLLHYYPSKLLWQSTVLSLPWFVVGVGLLAMEAPRRWPSAGPLVRKVLGGVAGVVTVFALALPWGSQLGTWSSVEGGRVMGAVNAPKASQAVVVWLEDSPTTDSVTRSLLDVLRVAETHERAPQARLSVQGECALLRAAGRPVVLSTAPQAEVRHRYACVSNVVVLPVTPIG